MPLVLLCVLGGALSNSQQLQSRLRNIVIILPFKRLVTPANQKESENVLIILLSLACLEQCFKQFGWHNFIPRPEYHPSPQTYTVKSWAFTTASGSCSKAPLHYPRHHDAPGFCSARVIRRDVGAPNGQRGQLETVVERRGDKLGGAMGRI